MTTGLQHVWPRWVEGGTSASRCNVKVRCWWGEEVESEPKADLPLCARADHADLSDTDVLVISGRNDPYARDVTELADALRARGARVDFRALPTGYELTGTDVTEAFEWIPRTPSLY